MWMTIKDSKDRILKYVKIKDTGNKTQFTISTEI